MSIIIPLKTAFWPLVYKDKQTKAWFQHGLSSPRHRNLEEQVALTGSLKQLIRQEQAFMPNATVQGGMARARERIIHHIAQRYNMFI